MRIKRKVIGAATVAVLSVLLYLNRDLIGYGFGQAAGQMQVVLNARAIEDVLRDEDVADSVKEKIRLVRDIRSFAFDSLDIDENANYTTYYDQHGKDLLWVVTACSPFSLEAYSWEFPILGSFGYKGFFDSLKAVEESEELQKRGYDTSVRPVGGWSTLGYFKDPVLSKMLERDEAELAELIIHELTHGTVYVKDSTRFNENLATFIGIKGAELFLTVKYGRDAAELHAYRQKKRNNERIVDHILRGAGHLDSLYGHMDKSLPPAKKLQLKSDAIADIIQTADTIVFSGRPSFSEYLERQKPNNTYFMSYLRYRGYLDLLESEFEKKYNGDIRGLLHDYKRRFPSL